jgi:hypothetical protein
MRTVNGITYDFYKETLCALGLADDDNEWRLALDDAVYISTPSQMRELFVLIMIHCNPTNPKLLWETYKNNMSEDLLHKMRILKNNTNITFDHSIYNLALIEIDTLLSKNGYNLKEDYPMMPQIDLSSDLILMYQTSSLITEELSYDINELNTQLEANLPLLNHEQKHIYDTIISRINREEKGIYIFLY